MSTYANITMGGHAFHVKKSGGDKEGIKETVESYVEEIRNKVVPSYLPTAVINAICAGEVTDLLPCFYSGHITCASYAWHVNIGEDGVVTIEGKELSSKEHIL